MKRIFSILFIGVFAAIFFSTVVFIAAGFSGAGGEIRSIAKSVARKAKTVVYSQATVHNPEGDTLPDWIDDVVLGKIKMIF